LHHGVIAFALIFGLLRKSVLEILTPVPIQSGLSKENLSPGNNV
jgi:hypothetical protein